MGPADSDRISRVLPYSGTGAPSQRVPVRGCHPLCPRLSSRLPVRAAKGTSPGPTTPRRPRPPRFAPLSLAATRGIDISFSSCGYWDVSVPRVRPPFGVRALTARGLPHSDTPGSFRACRSPGSFAARRVLHHRAPFSVSLRSPARASPPARDPGGDISPRGDSF